jgi:hypothetical protein
MVQAPPRAATQRVGAAPEPVPRALPPLPDTALRPAGLLAPKQNSLEVDGRRTAVPGSLLTASGEAAEAGGVQKGGMLGRSSLGMGATAKDAGLERGVDITGTAASAA